MINITRKGISCDEKNSNLCSSPNNTTLLQNHINFAISFMVSCDLKSYWLQYFKSENHIYDGILQDNSIYVIKN